MKKVVIAGMLGNGLEWYDYALYGQLAWLLSRHFFPAWDPAVQLLATYGVFAAGFIVRPLGGIFFGWIGDAYGRKLAMIIAMLMMAIPTGCIGLLPTYAQIGILAPFLLTLIRLLQGMSLAGEFSGSIAYIIEHASPSHRGLAGSASLVSMILGFMAGLLSVQLCLRWIDPIHFEDWGWRIPFLIGALTGIVGFYIRRYCSESPLFEEAQRSGSLSKKPVREAFKFHFTPMLQAFLIYISVTMPFYLTTVFFIGFSNQELQLSMRESLHLNFYNMLTLLVTMPLAAAFSDRVGRKPLMLTVAVLFLFVTYPLFQIMQPGAPFMLILVAQLSFSALVGCYLGPVPALLVELFPTSVRYTGMSIAYNLSAALFGGTAPMVCQFILQKTGNPLLIAGYVMLCLLLSLSALLSYKNAQQI